MGNRKKNADAFWNFTISSLVWVSWLLTICVESVELCGVGALTLAVTFRQTTLVAYNLFIWWKLSCHLLVCFFFERRPLALSRNRFHSVNMFSLNRPMYLTLLSILDCAFVAGFQLCVFLYVRQVWSVKVA